MGWVSGNSVFVGFGFGVGFPRGCLLGLGDLGVCDLGVMVKGLVRNVKSGCLLLVRGQASCLLALCFLFREFCSCQRSNLHVHSLNLPFI